MKCRTMLSKQEGIKKNGENKDEKTEKMAVKFGGRGKKCRIMRYISEMIRGGYRPKNGELWTNKKMQQLLGSYH